MAGKFLVENFAIDWEKEAEAGRQETVSNYVLLRGCLDEAAPSGTLLARSSVRFSQWERR